MHSWSTSALSCGGGGCKAETDGMTTSIIFVSLVSELIETAQAGSRGQDHADIARETLQEELPQECVVCGTGTLLKPT